MILVLKERHFQKAVPSCCSEFWGFWGLKMTGVNGNERESEREKFSLLITPGINTL